MLQTYQKYYKKTMEVKSKVPLTSGMNDTAVWVANHQNHDKSINSYICSMKCPLQFAFDLAVRPLSINIIFL